MRVANDANFDDQSPQIFLGPFRNVPHGFVSRSSRLGKDFMRLISHVAALYHPQVQELKANSHNAELEKLNNTQADLEGQLHELRQRTSDNMVIACIIAAFLCVYAFWTDIWNSALIPREMSKQMLYHIRRWQENESIQYDDDPSFWLVHVGRAFAIDPHVRAGFIEVSRSGNHEAVTDLSEGGIQSSSILYEFIWSEAFFQSKKGWFWERIITPI